jgi:DNA-binding transcriptional ArsR family regulator
MNKNGIVETEVETSVSRQKSQRLNERFLKGPIPLRHLAKAAKLPGQSLSVYLAIHHQTALSKREQVTLPKHLLGQFGVSRDAKARAMNELSKAGLVVLNKQKGRSSRVSLSSTGEMNRQLALAVINEQWAVVEGGISCLVQDYSVAKSQLTELRESEKGIAMWPLQLAEKSWVNVEAFIQAFDSALNVHAPVGFEQIDRAATYELARQIAAKHRSLR